jgi:hypothetical protein
MSKPIDKFVVGNVSLAVFENVVGKGKDQFTTQSVLISKNYKNKEGKWESTNSFKPSELVYVQIAIQEYLRKKYVREQVEEVTFEAE